MTSSGKRGKKEHRKVPAGSAQSVIGTSVCMSLSRTLDEDFDGRLVGGAEMGESLYTWDSVWIKLCLSKRYV